MTDRASELAAWLRFAAHHPYVLSDGRRFCSLELAADTVYGMGYDSTVIHEPSGLLHSWSDCARVRSARRDRRAAMA